MITITAGDVEAALSGFQAAALKDLSLEKSPTEWASIGGLEEAKAMLIETFMLPTTYAPLFKQVPIKLRSGLLLYGPPGTGKTLLASAIAGHCGLNFISVSGPELLNKYIGQSESSVRAVFERAAAAKPAILFFDEFEAIAPARGGDSTGVTDRVVNQFLTELDGVEGRAGVYVLAASSRPDMIDPALLRPGRLDKSIYCGFPDLQERESILRAVTRSVKLTEDVDFTELAGLSEDFSGADLNAIISTAQLGMVHDELDRRMALDAARLTAAAAATTTTTAGTTTTTNKSDAAVDLRLSREHLIKAVGETSISTSYKDRAHFARVHDKFLRARRQDVGGDASASASSSTAASSKASDDVFSAENPTGRQKVAFG
jgi:SpoVK/Ycf46/Vps4 family AAA+-type ATPase